MIHPPVLGREQGERRGRAGEGSYPWERAWAQRGGKRKSKGKMADGGVRDVEGGHEWQHPGEPSGP